MLPEDDRDGFAAPPFGSHPPRVHSVETLVDAMEGRLDRGLSALPKLQSHKLRRFIHNLSTKLLTATFYLSHRRNADPISSVPIIFIVALHAGDHTFSCVR
jgi:hypothetical protein